MPFTHTEGWVVNRGDQFFGLFYEDELDAIEAAENFADDPEFGYIPAFVVAATKVIKD